MVIWTRRTQKPKQIGVALLIIFLIEIYGFRYVDFDPKKKYVDFDWTIKMEMSKANDRM